MSVYNPNAFVLAVDTAQYAGNFEREMVAFITGQVGECGVGQGIAWAEEENIQNLAWFQAHAVQVQDDSECARPASIWPTPGRFNNGVGGHFDDTPEVRSTLDERSARAQYPAYESVAFFVDELPPSEVLDEFVARAKQYWEENELTYRGYRVLQPTYTTVSVKQVTGHEPVAPASAAHLEKELPQ